MAPELLISFRPANMLDMMRELRVTPYAAKNDMWRARNLDRKTTREPGYAVGLSWIITGQIMAGHGVRSR